MGFHFVNAATLMAHFQYLNIKMSHTLAPIYNTLISIYMNRNQNMTYVLIFVLKEPFCTLYIYI